jgi:hypothetical protein
LLCDEQEIKQGKSKTAGAGLHTLPLLFYLFTSVYFTSIRWRSYRKIQGRISP